MDCACSNYHRDVVRVIFYFPHSFYIHYMEFFWIILEIFIIWNPSTFIICPFSPVYLFFNHLYQCWFMNVYFILWVLIQYYGYLFCWSDVFSLAIGSFSRLSPVSFRHAPSLNWYYPALTLESADFSRSTGSYYWTMVFTK